MVYHIQLTFEEFWFISVLLQRAVHLKNNPKSHIKMAKPLIEKFHQIDKEQTDMVEVIENIPFTLYIVEDD